MKRAAIILALAAALGACAKRTEAPTDKGVCWVVTQPDKTKPVKFSVLARDQAQLEFCAARLEEMRIRFLRMGGGRKKVVGAYQGKFLWVDSGGVSLSDYLEGPRFVALRRARDGRLAIPGVFPMEQKDKRNVPAEGAPNGAAPAAPASSAPAAAPQG
ncbi:hypothetical protein [Caulobacter sp. 17J65-9]|uniref:hypothetical protein n=1 Tax=Caulobacter sp. 17J65-9 TaxID=2709382 RepID=UPI001969D773|nr:hypothetical protein [Caulobacter sp. 17J65-9]